MLIRILLTAALSGALNGCSEEPTRTYRASETTSGNGKTPDPAAKKWKPDYDREPELQPFDWNDSNASASEVERRILAQLGCNVELQPVSLARWLLKNRVVRSVGPGGDGPDILVPRKPLYILGMQVRTIEGWGKQHGPLRKTKHRGLAQVASDLLLNIIASNLIRIPKLITA